MKLVGPLGTVATAACPFPGFLSGAPLKPNSDCVRHSGQIRSPSPDSYLGLHQTFHPRLPAVGRPEAFFRDALGAKKSPQRRGPHGATSHNHRSVHTDAPVASATCQPCRFLTPDVRHHVRQPTSRQESSTAPIRDLQTNSRSERVPQGCSLLPSPVFSEPHRD